MLRDHLTHYPMLRTTDLDAAREFVSRVWVNHRSHLLSRGRFSSFTGHASLEKAGITYFRWSPVYLEGEDPTDQYIVDLHESGQVEVFLNGRPALATPHQAVLIAPAQRQQMKMHHCRALALHLPGPFVDQALKQRFRRWPPLHEWARELPLDRGPGASLKSLTRWAAEELDRPDSGLRHSPKAKGHLERTLRTLLVDCLAELYPGRARDDGALGSQYLRLIEEWMEAHLEEPIGIEDLAELAGVGVRSVQMAFRRYRGCTPLAALRQQRLQRARLLLLHPLPGTTVTKVAMNVGLFHLGRFTSHYRTAFGETSSATLARGLQRL